MYIEEMMIDYIMNKATQEEVEEFFGHTAYGVCTREACEKIKRLYVFVLYQ